MMLPNTGSTVPKLWLKLCRPSGLSILRFMGSAALVVNEAVQGVLEAAREVLCCQRNPDRLALARAYISCGTCGVVTFEPSRAGSSRASHHPPLYEDLTNSRPFHGSRFPSSTRCGDFRFGRSESPSTAFARTDRARRTCPTMANRPRAGPVLYGAG